VAWTAERIFTPKASGEPGVDVLAPGTGAELDPGVSRPRRLKGVFYQNP